METGIFQHGTGTLPTACVEMWEWWRHVGLKEDSANAIPCIRPNDPLFQMIQSESVGPGSCLHVLEHDVAAYSAHGCSLDAREGGVPVSPEEDPWNRKRDNY